MTFIKEPDGLPVKIRFDETSQFAAGSANVSVTRFTERSENSEGRLTSDIDTTTDKSEDRKSNNESLIKGQNKSDSSTCQSFT